MPIQAYSVAVAESDSTLRRDWPLDVCDCFQYRDPVTRDCVWFPYMFPWAMLSPCILTGKIQSLLVGEHEICCGMGEKGLGCCVLSAIPTCFSPFGGCCYFSMLALAWRVEMSERYNLGELPQTCTCWGSTLNPLCEIGHLSLLYPCSFFQIFVTLKEISREEVLFARAYVPS